MGRRSLAVDGDVVVVVVVEGRRSKVGRQPDCARAPQRREARSNLAQHAPHAT
ncbi:MAG: hypothetical protein IPG50_21645 [Myxococcales bacterium]|nr:hypothetical protein [Myxococcales bacterium]